MGEKASQVSRVEKEAESAIIDADARIIDIASPQSDGDAANKKYVDNRVPWIDFTQSVITKLGTQGVTVAAEMINARYRILPGNVVTCILSLSFTVGVANVDLLEIELPFDTQSDSILPVYATYDSKNEIQNATIVCTAVYLQRVVTGEFSPFVATKVNRTDIHFVAEHKPS